MFKKLFDKSGDQKVELLLKKNRDQLEDLTTRIDEMEKAVLNGEQTWFLTQCPYPKTPVCQNPEEENLPCMT